MRLEQTDFERSPNWFPFIGLLIGAVWAFGDAALSLAGFSGPLLAILSIGLVSAVTGGLHLDGLADTADGFLSARPRERVLEIMRDSRIGTMGVLALVFVLSIKVAALCELAGSTRIKTLLFAPLAGRAVQIITMRFLPYARSQTGGLASIFVLRSTAKPLVLAVLSLILSSDLLFGSLHGGILLIVVVLTITPMAMWSLSRIGGFTGDTLGATSEIVETTILLVARGLSI
jgi:adenosylcobinamide-GDP ribazoletransferase